ncbi:MAG: RraA family protein [Firmicutes bacterium]|nr:RraA family protein [Alicyclobacillaceae bacterium]MCL6496101.1 RraA family protein [Bacillota bacterium]
MDSIVEAFRALPIAAVSDALDRLGIAGTCLGIKPLVFGWKMVGRAFTVEYRPCGIEKGTVGDFIDDVPEGGVVVLDNAGRLDCTVWGDILTLTAHRRGLAGTVVWGVCRDVRKSRELNYPIFSCGHFMRTGKDRVEVSHINEPITVSEVQVRPGDLVIGEDDGVLVVPRERETEVLRVAQQIEAAESQILDAVRDGMRLVDARARFQYHTLQRRE